MQVCSHRREYGTRYPDEKLGIIYPGSQSKFEDPTKEAQPIYHLKLLSIEFTQEGGTLVLTQKRQAEAREPTSCAIRQLGLEKSKAVN
jgi:hypothetical protein